MRKNYIDNIRITCILLLFPYHVCRIFTEENFYVHVKEIFGCEMFVNLLSPWFMPILFFLAGMSTYLALNKRTTKEYIKERVLKLFVPCFFGVLLTVPIQTFYAEKFHNGYTGSYIQQLCMFFTKETDLSGYTGGFTPAHLWFLFVLFLIALITLPLILRIREAKSEVFNFLANPIVLVLLIIPIFPCGYIEVATEAVGKYIILFILGAIFCANEEILETVKKYRALFLGIMLVVTGEFVLRKLGVTPKIGDTFADFLYQVRMWSTILTILGYSMKYWNGTNKVMSYFKVACFPIYEIHQTIIVVVSYYIVTNTQVFALQYLGTILGGFILSIVAYEILSCFKVTRWLFAIKERKNQFIKVENML